MKTISLLKKGIVSIRSQGVMNTVHKAAWYLKQNRDIISFYNEATDYERWLELRSPHRKTIQQEIEKFRKRPKISIIMPVYNIETKWLSAAIHSVRDQLYSNWELCISDDGSSNSETLHFLKKIRDPRIKIQFLKKNDGISSASNSAIKMAEGEFVAFLDHDDEITEDALFEIVKAINAEDPDFIYSDEDKIDCNGKRRNPFFKPDWSPDLLRSQNYICHFVAIRKSILDKIGGFRKGFEGAQDYDLFLRVSEETNQICHIPKVLYSWREIETSTAGNPFSKPKAQKSGLLAVGDHLKRLYGKNAQVKECEHPFVYDAYFSFPDDSLVSIIIPTKDNIPYLDACVESIFQKSSHPKFEIIILNNRSQEADSKSWFIRIAKKYGNISIIEADYPFCWSRLNNHGIHEASGDVFIFLNNDTRVISSDWIERLGGHALRDDVGIVGPLLLYEDGAIQHAGVVVGLGGWADHVYKGNKPIHFGSPYVSPMVKRNVLAVTGSCMVISRKTLEKIGEFDESFLICGSDVEICIRAHEAGLLNVYDSFVRLYHYESKTRVAHDIPKCDFQMSIRYYKHYREIGGDPFYNKNLSLKDTIPNLI
ncbi:MAG: glycosyl transferase family 2 [Candidatus Moranbacteria bacterium CG23_combo_of_CG06-09_8_20_14_all_39_10]|nr:MAG: glycosyl transferase family 2 [Candidatus Moranbacteria bacterium CG23_combo_of_CG06-09_8_20_14_all_39_10]